MSKQALIIFVKNPELGKVKTRLAATVGDTKALEVYKILLEHTMKSTASLSQDKWVFYSEYLEVGDIWTDDIYHKQVQPSGSLGEKISAAFRHCFDRGYENVCIIGSDMMDISESIIKKAFQALDDYEVVIGPAQDGGYYLLGMNKLHPSLLEGKSWSTATVLEETIDDIKKEQLSYVLLPQLRDIDTESDWAAYLAGQ